MSYFNADIKAYNDYYPGGMLLSGRHGNTADYRYGFQGQEMDDEPEWEERDAIAHQRGVFLLGEHLGVLVKL